LTRVFSLKQVKLDYQRIRYQDTMNLEDLGGAEGSDDESATADPGITPIVEIDIATRMRRHAAPVRG
jgi:hypothetical protein